MKSETGRRRWVAGALRAGRAAAFLTLATGINGTIAALEPRYDPIYVYLLAVVIVAWLGGILLGITAAIAAVVLYDSMFGPALGGPSMGSLVPFVVAIGAAVVTQLARAPMIRPSFGAAAARPLLDTPTLVSVTPSIDPAELEDLRIQLADAGRRVDDARFAADREARLRLDAAAAAKARLAALQHELDVSRSEALEQAKRASSLHVQLDDINQRDRNAIEQVATLRRELERNSVRTGELETRLKEVTEELEVAWRRVDEEKARASAEAARLNELERQANDALQHSVADLAARYQQPLAEAKKSLEEAFTRIPQLEKERDEAKEAASDAETRLNVLQEEVDRVRALIDHETSRAEQEAALRDEVESAWREKLRTREQAIRDEMSAAFDAKLQSIVHGITSDYEESLGEATITREAARAELRSVTGKIEALQKRLAEQEAALGRAFADAKILQEQRDKAQERGSRLRTDAVDDYAARLQSSEARAASLLQEVNRLRADAEESRTKLEIERSQREQIEADFDRKIASIAAGLTSDYETSLGEAMVEKEGARAEIRNLTAKLSALEKQLAENRDVSGRGTDRVKEKDDARAAISLQEVNRLRAEVEDARTKLELERSHREQIEADFDRKIASIAAGLTSDYESSLGDALVDKEAAKAEIRDLNKKLASLESQLAQQRDLASRARTEASESRDDSLSEYAAKLLASEARAASLTAELERLKSDVENEKSRAELERSERERAASEFDRKLASIVAGITDDHEQALGEAVVQREGARAEARAAASKLEVLQRRLLDFDNLHAQVERSTSELRKSVEAERKRADNEKAAREKLDAEWSAKLQSIVNHLASDHEADVGQAMVEKEAAKAEVRDLTNRLKALQQKFDLERSRTASQRPTVSGGAARPAAILVVHSDAGMRAMTKHALEEAGYIVATAADGLEGLRAASAQRPDVVLAEAVMPKMNGRELLQLMKARSDTAGVKVILMSGQGGDGDRGGDFRSDDFLQTPSDFAAMRAAIANVLRK